jgi:hypothetical protein
MWDNHIQAIRSAAEKNNNQDIPLEIRSIAGESGSGHPFRPCHRAQPSILVSQQLEELLSKL